MTNRDEKGKTDTSVKSDIPNKWEMLRKIGIPDINDKRYPKSQFDTYLLEKYTSDNSDI